jgi:hypothetical protein
LHSIKPLQLVLNEFFKKLNFRVLVTKSAFTQARRNDKPEAFVTLNQKAVVDTFYADGKKRKSLGMGVYWLSTAPKFICLMPQKSTKNLEP